MFGYLDLEFGEDREFAIYQCSLCHALGKEYGLFARFFTNYDMALLLLLALGFGRENSSDYEKRLCPILSRNKIIRSKHSILRYVSAITVLLVSEKIKDDRYDEERQISPILLKWIGKRRKEAEYALEKLGFDYEIVEVAFNNQRELEIREGLDLVQYSGPTAHVMSEIYSFTTILNKVPEQQEALSEIGYSLGQIIYLLDSFLDYQSDLKKGIFNPLSKCSSPGRKDINASVSIKDKAKVLDLLSSAKKNVGQYLKELPQNAYLNDVLTKRLNKKIETYFDSEYMVHRLPGQNWVRGVRWTTPLSYFFSSTTLASASNGKGADSSFCGSLFFMIIMLVVFYWVCKGCLGGLCSTKPDKVTVDHGCGGQKTYKKDPCTGKYKADGCC